MIKDLNEAFEILKTTRKGIPFEAIEYLRNYPVNEDIINKIIFSIKNAYNSKIFYDRESDYYSPEPLWYAIIAENHLCEDLIEPVINLFLRDEGDWDFLNEQGSYLIGVLAEKYPDIVPEKVLSVIENEVKKKTKNIYLFLFDALYLLDIEKYKDRLLKILADKKNMYWLDSYAVRISDMQIKEALPILKEIKSGLEKVENIFTIRELDYAIEQLEAGKIEYPKYAKPYSKQRDDWENHYKGLEKCFYSDDEDDEMDDLNYDLLDDLYPDDESDTIINASPKIGRNDPCPCGSGKKYKKCCLN